MALNKQTVLQRIVYSVSRTRPTVTFGAFYNEFIYNPHWFRATHFTLLKYIIRRTTTPTRKRYLRQSLMLR